MTARAGPKQTVTQALREAAGSLAPTSDTARLDAELLMAHALGVSRSDLLLRHGGDPVPEDFAPLLARRLNHEPVAYILGRQEFYGRTFRVGPEVLIPRADSESVIAAALEAMPQPRRVLDCGTGSGALLLTLLAECGEAEGIGIDRSSGAVALARENADALGLSGRARLIERDWTRPGWASDLGPFDLILANPPYVESGARLAPSVHLHEPAGALFAGPEGLDDYRILIPQLPALLEPCGCAVLEIGASQSAAVAAMAADAGFSVEMRRDLGARPRALLLRFGLGKAVIDH
ncbi:peptide chain release factor N(5)-glutamine methyltransferase [Tsuneonella sp. CC-YZS046]|uniref:peptide chain release factor N(5)-glutamine methyltransferase n=1 Tax=Tsuneonella sp. CC-YZS046 TaxID=3042152 RepID=UPI002D779FED|nr:peptide chain release factor N(5)-glutamine methyltransferase [Tsuneonella sp. CC-YZS046]WRO65771.1 peptide chain release factor N(5)-glutamine methyltransferase [Tsuneonella sp. CC-YZS046]